MYDFSILYPLQFNNRTFIKHAYCTHSHQVMLRVESSLNLHASERNNIKVTSGRQRPLYGTAFLNSQLPSNLNRKNVTEIKVDLLVVCFKDYFLSVSFVVYARTAPVVFLCVCDPHALLAHDGPVWHNNIG